MNEPNLVNYKNNFKSLSNSNPEQDNSLTNIINRIKEHYKLINDQNPNYKLLISEAPKQI